MRLVAVLAFAAVVVVGILVLVSDPIFRNIPASCELDQGHRFRRARASGTSTVIPTSVLSTRESGRTRWPGHS